MIMIFGGRKYETELETRISNPTFRQNTKDHK